MTTATIFVRDRDFNLIPCRALLDTCATTNFISEGFIKKLNLPVTACAIPIGAINTMNTISKGVVQIIIQSTYNKFSKTLNCLTIPTISDLVPSEVFPREKIEIPPNIALADPEFHLPRPINLLISSGATLSLFLNGKWNLSHDNCDLYLQKTKLGWIVAGGNSKQRYLNSSTCALTNLEQQISKFWLIEEVANHIPKSSEEINCELHFMKNIIRHNDGRYIVRLPFRKDITQLGASRNIALKRLYSLERKLDADPKLKSAYTQVIQEYLNLGHMSLINAPSNDGFYMPHHAVIKNSSDTTKVRVVFDASAKTDKGNSLNDMLMVGPTIQDPIFAHLLRFRTYNYVLTADIEKMYRQVVLHEDDRKYQRILWRENKQVKTFQLNTLTFGVSSSPYLAIRTIQKLADDERHIYPKAAQVLKSHLYVDDLLTGTKNIDDARTLRDEIIALLSRGGFNIRQWASNDKRIIRDLNSDAINANLILDKNNPLKTLGITWSATDDVLRYTVRPISYAERVTKRIVLSEIAKIFDPLGILGPVILHAKVLMQKLWQCKLDWDEPIPLNMYNAWTEFATQLNLINELTINRIVLLPNYHEIHMHGFCDASKLGYGACLYIRTIDVYGNICCRLLCAKSRVAPLNVVTIPRLELCGALLLAKLYHETINALGLSYDKITLWSDSTVALHWIQTPSHLLKQYVAHRVIQINELTRSIRWRHVNSKNNPADVLSRGQLPKAFVNNQFWFSGPPWLSKNESEWPCEIMKLIDIPELRKNICLTTETNDCYILKRYSSYAKMLRIIALCLRFRPRNAYRGLLCVKEIEEAEIRIIKIVQTSSFAHELDELINKRFVRSTRIATLNPFIDTNGVIRVGGRLKRSKLTFSQRHPVLLPSRHFFTDLIIRNTHENHYHTGIQMTLHIIRQKFWLLDGRNQVRKIVRSCTRCFRFNTESVKYKMGDLPKARVQDAFPFINTGVDYCGPFYIKEKKYRNKNKIKVYVCVFVCMAIKAVHLEIVSDLTTDGFLAAFKRFIARRGIPKHVYSDNATNFVGANNHLKELYALFNSDEHKNQLIRFSTEHHITWHFIPPIAPHFGGLWESTVKLFKHHFKRVVGDSLFTFEELNTFTVEIEGILNSRPISILSSDPNDLSALTPAHYLIGRPLTYIPESDYSPVPINRLSIWQHITKVRQDFWSRWHLEYLNELQTRRKWIKDGEKIEVGMIVLIKEKNLPCLQWAIGRINEIHPGADGVIRTVTIKTTTGDIKRSVKCISPLPI